MPTVSGVAHSIHIKWAHKKHPDERPCLQFRITNGENIYFTCVQLDPFSNRDTRHLSPPLHCERTFKIHVGILSVVKSRASRELPALLADTVSWELVELIEKYLEPGIAFVGEECRETVASNPHNLAQSLLNLLG